MDLGLTKLLKHFVALIKDEMFYVRGIQHFFSSKSVETARSGDDDMGAASLVFE